MFGLKEKTMIGAVKIQVKPEEIIEAVKGMGKRKREAFLEDLLPATSPEYLKSIREARADYKAKRVRMHEEVFGK
jgi:ABC-type proline/glycine betaine transport system permease subunit